MQTMGVTGKIYNLKQADNNGKIRVTFRIGVRKQFVSDQDKTDGKTMTFMPMIAYGPTAEFIVKFFKDGDTMAIGNMEYQTYRTANAPNEFDDAHIFKVDKVGFVGGQDNDAGGSSNRQQGGGGRPQQQQQTQQRTSARPAQQQQQQPQHNIADDDLPF